MSSFWRWADQFESYLDVQLEDRFSHNMAYVVLIALEPFHQEHI